MKRSSLIIGIVALVVVVLVALLSGSMTFMTGREVVVDADLYTVSMQVTDLHNWGHWYPGFKDESGFTVTASSPTAVVVKDGSVYESFALTPSADGKATTVRWTSSSTALGWLGEHGPGGRMSKGLDDLKRYIEDPAGFYGFSIAIEPVTDTLILTDTQPVTLQQREAARLGVLGRLKAFASGHHISGGAAYSYSSYRDIGKDSVEVAVGLPVRGRGYQTGSARFLELPAGGRLLVGKYKGSYTSMETLYRVMNKYVVDRGLRKVAAPLEKYAEGSGEFELCFPIY